MNKIEELKAAFEYTPGSAYREVDELVRYHLNWCGVERFVDLTEQQMQLFFIYHSVQGPGPCTLTRAECIRSLEDWYQAAERIDNEVNDDDGLYRMLDERIEDELDMELRPGADFNG
jgi:hypothetical protein